MDSAFWFNLVQNVVLLATLLVVLRQLRQMERTTQRDALMRAVEDHDRLNELLLQYPKLMDYFGPASDYSDWSSEEVNFMTFLTLALGRFERLHALRRQGLVEDDLWDSWVKWVRETWFATELALRIWDKEGCFYSSSFQRFINELLANDLPANAGASSGKSGKA
jgi:hypothetical protein